MIRAVRGWSLGTPIHMGKRRTMPEVFDCPCKFHRPYLHSPLVEDLHWDGPFMRNRIKGESKNFDSVVFGGTGSVWESREDNDWDDEYFLPGNYGGFYTYKPAFANNMGRWDEVDVIGIVSLYYDVDEHEFGYRSDGLLIEAIWVLWDGGLRYNKEKLIDHLERVYECYVHILPRDQCQGFKDWILREDFEKIIEVGMQEA